MSEAWTDSAIKAWMNVNKKATEWNSADADEAIEIINKLTQALQDANAEVERLREASELLIDQIFVVRGLLGEDGEYSITRSDGDGMGFPQVIFVGEQLDLIDCHTGNLQAALKETE